MAELASTMAGFDAVQAQFGPTLHDLMETAKDAPRELQKLWAEDRGFRQTVSKVFEAG